MHGMQRLIADLRARGVVTSDTVAKVMVALDRSFFAPCDGVYKDQAIAAHSLSSPSAQGAAMQAVQEVLDQDAMAASVVPLRALDLGAGSGYTAACLALLLSQTAGGGSVVAVDAAGAALQLTRKNVRRAATGMASTSAMAGDLLVGSWSQHLQSSTRHLTYCVANALATPCSAPELPRAAFDIIHVGAAFEAVPPAVEAWLAPGGRIVGPVLLDGAGSDSVVTVFDELGGQLSSFSSGVVVCEEALAATDFSEANAALVDPVAAMAALKAAQTRLVAWQADFKSRNGHKPSQSDFEADDEGRRLVGEAARTRAAFKVAALASKS
jgi:protein-L-isoaspartate O-methyltransferase